MQVLNLLNKYNTIQRIGINNISFLIFQPVSNKNQTMDYFEILQDRSHKYVNRPMIFSNGSLIGIVVGES